MVYIYRLSGWWFIFKEDCPKVGSAPILGATIGEIIHRPGRINEKALLLKTKGVVLWAGSLKRRPKRRLGL